MNVLVVETPEGVHLRFALAGIGSRAAAGLLDVLVIGLASAVIVLGVLAAAQFDPSGVSTFVASFVVAGLLLGWIAYFALFHAWWSGETPGKRALGLRVIGSDGRPATAVQMLSRSILWPIEALVPIPFASIGIVLIAAGSRHQRLGDLVARTVVVRAPKPERTPEPFSGETYAALAAPTTRFGPAEAARLTPRDVAFLRKLLTRDNLTDDARRTLFVDAARHYARRLGSGAFEDARVFLRELYVFARDVR